MNKPDDIIRYRGKDYPVMHPTVTIDAHDDDWLHCYPIAPESLLDAMVENTPNYDEDGFEFGSIESNIDDGIYHYIEDKYWDLPLEEICKKHLDTPMTLIKK